MKYREEVLAKIFTYVTVLLLLGIVVFEAWMLQSREKQCEELEVQAGAAEDELQRETVKNASLQTQKDELEAFRAAWEPYTGYLGNEEIEKMSGNLFARTGLIPQEAQDALADWIAEQEQLQEAAAGGGYTVADVPVGEDADVSAQDTDGSVEVGPKNGKNSAAAGAKSEEDPAGKDVSAGMKNAEPSAGKNPAASDKEETGNAGRTEADRDGEENPEAVADESPCSLWLSYRSPEGERLFLPINTGSGDGSCLIYTAVYERLTGARMELLFGIRYSERTGIERDENGRIAWRCLAYRLADSGWQGIGTEQEDGKVQSKEEEASK